MARSYAPDLIVPTVPMTPMCPPRVAATAARAPGSTTPITGMSSSSRSAASACAVAVLHAMTMLFTPSLAQEGGDLAAVAPHGIRALRAVRHARRVAEVDDALVRQLANDLVRDRQSADARVEDADGARDVAAITI